MITAIGTFLAFIAVWILGEAIRSKLHYKLYEEGRTRWERERNERYRRIALVCLGVMLGANWVYDNLSRSAIWLVVFAVAFCSGLYFMLKASVRTGLPRALLALAAVLLGTGFLIWGVLWAPLLAKEAGVWASPLVRIAAALMGGAMFYAAVRLARSPRAPA